MTRTSVDPRLLHAALDAARQERALSWRALAREIGVSPSLMSRLSNGLKPDTDGFATLIAWLRMPAEEFFSRDEIRDPSYTEPDLMAQLAPLLRARRDLTATDVEYLEQVIGATIARGPKAGLNGMRRGFKSAAKRLALELRGELGLGAHEPFDPYAFAHEYGIQVLRLSELDTPARHHFLKADGSGLSGALIPLAAGTVILENDAQPAARRRTTMCHELSHVVLEHQFSASLATDERKCGLAAEQEEEADWLSGEILVPTDGAIRLARSNASDELAANVFDVSLAVARWRMNQSGARIVVRRARAKRTVTPRRTV